MKPWLGLVMFVGMSVWLAPARQSRSDEAADERLQAVKELLEQSVDWYDVLVGAEAKADLRPQVVLSLAERRASQHGGGRPGDMDRSGPSPGHGDDLPTRQQNLS